MTLFCLHVASWNRFKNWSLLIIIVWTINFLDLNFAGYMKFPGYIDFRPVQWNIFGFRPSFSFSIFPIHQKKTTSNNVQCANNDQPHHQYFFKQLIFLDFLANAAGYLAARCRIFGKFVRYLTEFVGFFC